MQDATPLSRSPEARPRARAFLPPSADALACFVAGGVLLHLAAGRLVFIVSGCAALAACVGLLVWSKATSS